MNRQAFRWRTLVSPFSTAVDHRSPGAADAIVPTSKSTRSSSALTICAYIIDAETGAETASAISPDALQTSGSKLSGPSPFRAVITDLVPQDFGNSDAIRTRLTLARILARAARAR